MFSCECCKIFENSFLIEHLRWVLLNWFLLDGELDDDPFVNKDSIFKEHINNNVSAENIDGNIENAQE